MQADVPDNIKDYIKRELSKKSKKKPASRSTAPIAQTKKKPASVSRAGRSTHTAAAARPISAPRASRAPTVQNKSAKRPSPAHVTVSAPHKKRNDTVGPTGKLSVPSRLFTISSNLFYINFHALDNSNCWSQLRRHDSTQTTPLIFGLIKSIDSIRSLTDLQTVDFQTVSNFAFNNISCTSFSSAATQLLSLGLRYIPKPTDYTLDELINSFNMFRNKINWSYYILFNPILSNYSSYNRNLKLTAIKQFDKVEMPFVTPIFVNFKHELDSLVIKHQITNNDSKLKPSALTISNLKIDYPYLKFVQADKNLGLVCMDLKHYNSMVMQHLGNNDTYNLIGLASDNLKTTLINEVTTKMKNILAYLDKSFSKQEKAFLHESISYVYPIFHCLPKLHKTPLKGRPIVGSPNWVTTRLSIYLADELLKVLPPDRFPNILKNTGTLIDKLNVFSTRNLDNLHLVSFDITSLYTNIDVHILLDILFEINPKFAMIAEFICTNNYFIYGENLYHQLSGIAMGTNVAVLFANLYLGCLLDPIIKQHHLNLLYYRYIDDGFILARGALTLIESLINELNTIIPNIKLTHNINLNSVDFLDITIFKAPELFTLQYKTFQKALNKYLYLPPFSYHHKSTISGFVIGELNRYNLTNSMTKDVYNIRCLFRKRLLARGYPAYFIDAIYKHKPINLTCLPPSIKNHQHMVPFFIRYTNSPFYLDLVKCFNKHSKMFAHLIDDNQIIMPVYTTSFNLIKLLLKSNITQKQIALLKI